jgi:hypothetical protein
VAIGLKRTLRLLDGANALAESGITTNGTSGIKSPWAPATSLSRIIATDILGAESLPVSRTDAMGVPAIARGRHKLVTAVQKCRLVTYRRDVEVDNGPAWLYRTKTRTSPQHRLVWTVDDLIFYGWSLWAAERNGKGEITDAGRIPPEWWTFGDAGEILVTIPGSEQTPIGPESAILIPGFTEGIINTNPRTIRGARQLEDQWTSRAANPIPAMELHQETDDELTDDEIVELLDGWQDALSGTDGAVAYTPKSIKAIAHGLADSKLLIEGRNAAAVDAARILGMAAGDVDASGVNSTLTYETKEGQRSQFLDDAVPLFTDAIAARLSLDDVTPQGTRIAFDLSPLVSRINLVPPTED